MWGHVAKDASPNFYAWKVYSGNFFFQLFIALVIPGYQQEGLPVPSLGYKTLMYNCNANLCFYTTLITAAVLHHYHIFRLTAIIDNYGHIMTVSMIYGFGVSLITYLHAVLTGTALRMSGNFFYDYFMGAELNPRLGSVDMKMWAEVRIPWVIVFFLSISGACKQYETYGYVTPNMAFMILATGLYINAWWGFMVIFWNFSGVPFSYVYSVVYMASHDPSTYRFSTAGYVFIYTVLCTAYYIWDTAMSQKSRFKMQTQGRTEFRKTFPQLPGGIVKKPTYIQTAHGNRLLTSGWWAYSRKPNYVADWIMSLTWGAIIGTATIIPYFYSVFFIVVLLHRCTRDFERCSMKYVQVLNAPVDGQLDEPGCDEEILARKLDGRSVLGGRLEAAGFPCLVYLVLTLPVAMPHILSLSRPRLGKRAPKAQPEEDSSISSTESRSAAMKEGAGKVLKKVQRQLRRLDEMLHHVTHTKHHGTRQRAVSFPTSISPPIDIAPAFVTLPPSSPARVRCDSTHVKFVSAPDSRSMTSSEHSFESNQLPNLSADVKPVERVDMPADRPSEPVEQAVEVAEAPVAPVEQVQAQNALSASELPALIPRGAGRARDPRSIPYR
ncbi:hypothetical protein NLJ89_g10041 [Agrocybe chaxingu]|uniref:Delta(24(24(1)))-sterol reductase n=1 Tax=Agrocybe chaxingu TaxID=84603 RepID=A0A9W8JZF8_9AGAR|nr:hypothetical protein NLJ89_g10041 [Agrocybe chaxingu]